MNALRLLAAAAACALVVSSCSRSDTSFDAKVHDYILAHPEVIQQAIAKLQARQDQQAAAQTKIAIAQNRQSLERDPRDFVANPNGKITLTEFYDYRCPHCINAAAAVAKIIHDDPDVRVVFKELPIFGATSEHAASGAIALHRKGGDELALYMDFMNTRALDDAAIDRILRAHGVDPASLDTPPLQKAAREQLVAVHNLAADLGIDGTPAFIIGDTLVPGDDTAAVNAAILQARGHSG
jgi:protein-disulfide isomerase